ncbi:hypothetical protein LLG95_13380 [bacterium]|nr:hypothetical protein [bacterium]
MPLRLFQLFVALLAALFLAAPYFPEKWHVVIDTSGAVFLFDRGHGHWIPLDLLWGTLGWARIPAAVRVALVIVVAGLCLWPWNRAPFPNGAPASLTRRRMKIVAGLSVLCGILFALLSVDPKITRTFGDVSSLQMQIRGGGWVFPSEVLTMHLYNAVDSIMITISGGADLTHYVGRLTLSITGAVFVWAGAIIALLIGRDRVEQLFMFAGPVLAGYLAQFFGYVETTFLVMTAFALFLAASAWMLQGEGSAARRNRLMLVFASLSMAMLAHGAGVVLLPATALLALCIDPAATGWARLRPLKDPWITLGFAGIVMVPYYLFFIQPFMIDVEFAGNMHGGADQFNFVPWDYKKARAVSSYVYYGMISWRHAADVGMGFLVGAPLGVPMALAAMNGLKRLDRFEREFLTVVALAAASAASVPMLWELDFGGWGDWNIITAYVYPLNFLGWVALLMARRRMPVPVWSVLVPAIVVQIAMWMGIHLQFYK